MRLVYGDMAGVVFLCWIPILAAFFLPWSLFMPDVVLVGELTVLHLAVAGLIAVFPWIVLILHLVRGRIWDGILDMLLWAIWECLIVITLCYLYPDRAQALFWNASTYWEDMREWLMTGQGTEGDPSKWLPIHLTHLGLIHVGAFILGLPALILGVFQLNFMNFYVANCLRASSDPFLTLPVAWHFWSIIRVIGFITIATAIFQMFLRLVFSVPSRWSTIWLAWISGIIFVVADALLKWQFAEKIRLMLNQLCSF